MDLEINIRSFIRERFLFDPNAELDRSQSLMRTGVLDSTGVIELVMYIEETFGIKVADEEMIAQNLDTIADIARFVEQKTTTRSAA
jgi:acyl carrier protein